MSDLRIPNFAGAVQAPDFLSGQSMILDALDKIRKQRLAEEQAATQDARAQAYLANQQATAAHYMKRDETVQQRADANDKKIAAQGRHTWQNDVITGLKNGVLPPGARIEMRDQPMTDEDVANSLEGQLPIQSMGVPQQQQVDPSMEGMDAGQTDQGQYNNPFSAASMNPSIQGSMMEIPASGVIESQAATAPIQSEVPIMSQDPPKQRKILVADYEGEPQEFDMSAMEEQKDAEIQDHIAKLEAERDMPGNEAMVPKIQAEIIAARTKMSKEGHKAILGAQSQDQKSTDKLMLQNDKQEGDMEKEKFRQDRIDARMRMRAKKGAKTAKELAAKNEELDKQLKPGERNAILGAYRTIEVRVARADKVTQSYRRLKMAEDELNSDPKNPDNAMALAETFLNQNGVLREGVPVKHETDFILDTANKLNKWKLEARGMAGYAMQPELIRQLKVANEILKKNYQRFMQDTVKSVQSTGRGFSKPGRMVFQNLANGAYVVGGNEPMQIWKDTPLDTSNDVELFQKGGEDTETKAKSAKDAINGLRDMGLIK